MRLLAAAFLAGLAGLAAPAMAHWTGPSDPAVPDTAWWKGLHSSGGAWCCDQGDGHRVEVPDWRINTDGTYSVRIDGKWRPIDPSAVVTTHNPTGFAVLWKFGDYVPCFMPGAEG